MCGHYRKDGRLKREGEMVKKALFLLVGVIVVVAVVKSGGDDSPSSKADAAPVESAPAPAAREARAEFELNEALSSCEALPDEARIIFRVAVKNTGDGDGEATVLPIRRYNDGSTNRSVMDVMSLDVPAGASRVLRAEFDYNALKHDLIECGVRLIPDGVDTAIAVV